ncbi:phytanoyl-CoA dioxygenase family protein [Actimicrobium antarcticum]|uniref:Phytanoyl-CoA dioxygenase n=1 Tax=Actimicrobium antarcticum TaxID=1051899 RepID=A0ABP7SR79_9BURK
MDINIFKERIDKDGFFIIPNLLTSDFVAELNRDCLSWVNVCEQYQISAGINVAGDGTGHHSVGANDSIDRFIAQHILHKYIDTYFNQKPYILHACNPLKGEPKKLNYVHNIHRDTKTFIPDYHFRLNIIVMLDDFKKDNGATQVLLGSHLLPERPDEIIFNKNHVSLLGKAGTVVLFNSYLWHKGGINITDKNRVALTLSFSPAFIKPQMDYARLLGEEYGRNLSDLTRQVLGYNARVPISLKEWYQTSEHRLYHSNQG